MAGESGLAICLSKPFQRLLKYPLLFQNLLYQCADNDETRLTRQHRSLHGGVRVDARDGARDRPRRPIHRGREGRCRAAHGHT